MRVRNWQSVFARTIEEHRHRPFRWGEHDCVLFAADVVKALTGVDHASPFRGLYDSPAQAMRIAARYGGLRGAVCTFLGQEINPKFAQRGDVVLMKNGGRLVLGACVGAKCVCPGETGLVFLKMRDAIAAWKVN